MRKTNFYFKLKLSTAYALSITLLLAVYYTWYSDAIDRLAISFNCSVSFEKRMSQSSDIFAYTW